MNYFMRMLAAIGWIWSAIFGVFLLILLKKRPRKREGEKEDAKVEF